MKPIDYFEGMRNMFQPVPSDNKTYFFSQTGFYFDPEMLKWLGNPGRGVSTGEEGFNEFKSFSSGLPGVCPVARHRVGIAF